MSAKDELIEGLNQDLNRELEAVLRFVYHSATATSLLGHELRELLKKDVLGELQHAIFLADKIAAMGGTPTTRAESVPTFPDNMQMLRAVLEAEQTAIRNYKERIQQADEYGDIGLRVQLENMIADETTHKEEVEKLISTRG